MNQLLPCPTCQKITLLPAGVAPDSTIRCPKCGDQYVLQDLLESQLGYWQVVEDASMTPVALALPEELQLAAPEPSPPAPLPKKTDWSSFQPISHEEFERMKRKSRSPIWSVLQIVLGGVAAVPIALLLIWHLLGTDIADAGVNVGKVAPWLVPEKFRPYQPPDVAPEVIVAKPPTRKSGDSGFRKFDELAVDEHTESLPDNPAPALGITASDNSAAAASPTASSRVFDNAVDNGVVDNGTVDKGEVETLGDSLAAQSSSQYALQLEEALTLLKQTENHLDQWQASVQAKAEDASDRAQTAYASLASLALAIDGLPAGNPALRTTDQQLSPLGNKIKLDMNLRRLVSQGAPFWIKTKMQKNPTSSLEKNSLNELPASKFGLAILVIATELTELGDQWLVTASSTTQLGSPPLEIVVPKQVLPSLKPGQALLMLGTVEPAKTNRSQSAPSGSRFVANYSLQL